MLQLFNKKTMYLHMSKIAYIYIYIGVSSDISAPAKPAHQLIRITAQNTYNT